MIKLTFAQARKIIAEHNQKYGIKSQFEDSHPITLYIVYKQSNWDDEYSETSRTYVVRSDNKYFLPNMISNSLIGNCLDGTDDGVRLDWYNWEIEYVYIKGYKMNIMNPTRLKKLIQAMITEQTQKYLETIDEEKKAYCEGVTDTFELILSWLMYENDFDKYYSMYVEKNGEK